MAAHINTLGLILDIVGVVFLFNADGIIAGAMKLENGIPRMQHSKWKEPIRKIGLCLMVGGFACQIVSGYLKDSI